MPPRGARRGLRSRAGGSAVCGGRSSRSLPPPLPELLAGHDRLHQTAEGIAIRLELRLHRGDGLVVRRDEAPAEGVGEELAAQVVEVIVLPFLLEVSPQAGEAVAVLAVGERCDRCDRLAAEIGL